MKNKFAFLAAVASLGLLSALPVQAQFSLDEIEANVGSLSDEMTRVDALLSDPDPNKRLAAMDMLIKSGNLDYAARAKEVGLFSSDKQMQRRALNAIFDNGGPFRVDALLNVVADDKTWARSFIKTYDGSFRDNDSIGSVIIYLGEFDKTAGCWPARGQSYCSITPTGDQYVIRIGGMLQLDGILSLGADGVLSGSGIFREMETFPIRINLAE